MEKDTMANTMRRDKAAAPAVVDRSTFQAELDALRVREKVHTREGDAIAAARRRLPMVEMVSAIQLMGEGRRAGASIVVRAGAGARLGREELDRRAAAVVSAYAGAHDELSRLAVDGSIPGSA
jgi:hypothetical protein